MKRGRLRRRRNRSEFGAQRGRLVGDSAVLLAPRRLPHPWSEKIAGYETFSCVSLASGSLELTATGGQLPTKQGGGVERAHEKTGLATQFMDLISSVSYGPRPVLKQVWGREHYYQRFVQVQQAAKKGSKLCSFVIIF